MLQEIGQECGLLGVTVRDFAEPDLLGLALICLRIQQHARLCQFAKLIFDVQQNALFDVLFSGGLLLRGGPQLPDAVLLVTPIEGLSLKDEAGTAGVLRKKIDVLKAEVAHLKAEVRYVFGALPSNIHLCNLGLEAGFTEFRSLF